jgi:hypothetical protein
MSFPMTDHTSACTIVAALGDGPCRRFHLYLLGSAYAFLDRGK